LKQTLW